MADFDYALLARKRTFWSTSRVHDRDRLADFMDTHMKLGFSGDVRKHPPRHSAVLPCLFWLVGDILTQGLAERQGYSAGGS
jgi:hypothetical protein